MGLDGRLADHQRRRSPGSRARGDQLQHLQLACGELADRGGMAGGRGAGRGELLDDGAVIAGASSASPASNGSHPVDQLRPRHILQQEAAGPRQHRLVHVLVEVERGQDQNAGRPAPPPGPGWPGDRRPGMRMSIRTTSGRSLRASATASAPLPEPRPPRFLLRGPGSSETRPGPGPGRPPSGGWSQGQPGAHGEPADGGGPAPTYRRTERPARSSRPGHAPLRVPGCAPGPIVRDLQLERVGSVAEGPRRGLAPRASAHWSAPPG